VRVLVTNDDGIEAPGLATLAGALHEADHDVLVVAPVEDMSGVSAAIGRVRADQRIDLRDAGELRGARSYAIAAPPGLAVMAACLGAFGDPPELVVSGVNAGPNLGHACLHSGTVGAALTASTFGVSALATSLQVSDPMRWETAAGLLAEPLALLAELPAGTVLNLNVPPVAPDEVRGVRWASLDRFGRVRLAIAGRSDAWLQMEYRSSAADLDPGCDTALLEQGYATLTAIEAVTELPADRLRAPRPAPVRATGTVQQVPGSDPAGPERRAG
jgi:5'-nucleotidase